MELLVMAILIVKVTLTFGDENEYRLVRDLFKAYDKRVRPSIHYSKAVNMTYAVALAQIIDVDEKNQIITTNCWLNQNWMDPKLRWEPGKYGNISVIRIPYRDIWKPDVVLYNNADVSSTVTSVSSNVIINHFGNVTWLSMSIFRSSCSIDVKYFPYDIQNCTMEFASWTYGMDKLNIISDIQSGDISNYVPSSEWELLDYQPKRSVETFSCCPDEPVPFMKYYIVIKRRPLFYLFNMVMPCVLITIVALLGFYMPPESGEKVSMGITTLLSIVVFLMIVAESMPPTSDVVPLIGLYYGVTIAIVSSATAMTVLTLNIHHKGARGIEVPHTVKKIFFGLIAKVLFIKLDLPSPPPGPGLSRIPLHDHCQYESPDFEPEIPTQNGGLSPRFVNRLRVGGATPTATDNVEQQFLKVLKKVYQTIERNETRLQEQDRKDILKQEWQQLALVLDRLLLLVFIIVTITVTLVVMIPQDYNLSK
ncbi:ligand-gated ion channel 4-like [Mercenaria mercenaria]|uniref:ligand-gated ion channel 4-like n=1 Tax=Mercenaria mercenaria TaxID=6596 RepID=UPI001E1D99B9|nr:ligand-gated ion channel 4-like [Mercenaria mercenaria]XP_045169532.1 ligand-gated ion channel 4-like [Mercenaria mercenaria]XP_045169533.1 ligand-gated ion channel 4-like [Mercenaria mercenaria]XP_053374547.1 ligand-gated ion channel 4-like [Mercenaria mercenaria]